MERVKATRPDTAGLQELYSLTSNAALLMQRFHCDQCGNENSENTLTDTLRGDTICMGIDGKGCGAIILDHVIHRGSEKRNFEDVADRNHHGPAPDRLMPDVVNMETSLNIQVKPGGKSKESFKQLQYAHQATEMNLSKVGNDEKHTREGYKTKQKRDAFGKMEEIGTNLNVHQAVINYAKEIFAWYRMVKEAVHDFEGTVIACLVLAFEDLSKNMRIDEIKVSYDVVAFTTAVTSDLPPPLPPVTNDVALSLYATTPLSKFTALQLSEWLAQLLQHLVATHSAFQLRCDFANQQFHERSLKPFQDLVLQTIGERVKKVAVLGSEGSDSGSVKPGSSSSGIFGCTTISNRQRFYSQQKKGEDVEEDRYGKHLLTMNLHTLFKRSNNHNTDNNSHNSALDGNNHSNDLLQAFTNEEIEVVLKCLHEAIDRRSQADKQYRQQLEAYRSQQHRLLIEKSHAIPSRKRTFEAVSGGEAAAKKSMDGDVEEIVLADNIDLEELFGGPVVTMKAATPAIPAASTVAVKTEPTVPTNVVVDAAVPVIKKEVPASSGLAAETKKIGSRPRPRVVIK